MFSKIVSQNNENLSQKMSYYPNEKPFQNNEIVSQNDENLKNDEKLSQSNKKHSQQMSYYLEITMWYSKYNKKPSQNEKCSQNNGKAS